MGPLRMRRLAAVLIPFALGACGDSGSTSNDDANRVASVTVTPTSAQADVGQGVQFQAIALNSGGTPVPGASFTWSSSDTQVATVSASGRAEALASGPTTISARVNGITGTASLFVNDPFPPTAPSGLSASTVDHQAIRLDWNDNSSSEGFFKVSRADAPGAGEEPVFEALVTLPEGARSHVDEGLEAETTLVYRVEACNDNGCTADPNDATGTTNPELAIATEPELPEGETGVPYSLDLIATGGDAAYTWSLPSGSLPEGLTLEPQGSVSGTPTGSGRFEFGLLVTSGDAQTAELDASLFILGPLEIVTAQLPDGDVAETYSAILESIGGRPPVQWSVAEGALPDGIELDGVDGVLSGQPAATGTTGFTVQASSQDGQVTTAELQIEVEQYPLSLTTTSVTGALVGQELNQQIEASGGSGARVWSVLPDGDPLPDGTTLDPVTGQLVGRPVRVGSADVVLQVVSGDETDTGTVTIPVSPGPLAATPIQGGGYLEVPYQAAFDVLGGDGITYVYSVVDGELPPGLSLNESTGEITGTPSEAGAYFFRIRVESAGFFLFSDLNLTISTAAPDGFSMWAMDVADSRPSPEVLAALDRVLARWEEVVVGDLPDWSLPDNPLLVPDQVCGGNGAVLRGVSGDDVTVLINVGPIDGGGGVLGFAGPCYIRLIPGGQWLTSVGVLTLDATDLVGMDADRLFSLIWHEIGHIMGIGTLWDFDPNDFLLGEGGPDPRFTGEYGVSGYAADGGAETSIPVANTGGNGTRDSHWREETFDTEIMTGYSEIGGFFQPISLMTVLSLQDLGFGVDPEAADPFVITSTSGATDPVAGQPFDRILDEPLRLIMPDGRIMVVPRPR